MARPPVIPKLVPRCYVCGERVADAFTLAAMQDDVDRVFVAHTVCARQMDPDSLRLLEVRA